MAQLKDTPPSRIIFPSNFRLEAETCNKDFTADRFQTDISKYGQKF